MEMNQAMRLLSGRIPLVPLQVTARGAAWFGKWTLNTDTETVKAMGGPWQTEQDAVAAVLATGQYQLRTGTKTPHLDRV